MSSSSNVTAGHTNYGKKSQFDFNQEHLEATDFFQSLQLQYTKQAEEEMVKELPKEKLDDLTFFESIGLYWVNPADKPGDCQQDQTASTSSKMKLWDHSKEERQKELNQDAVADIDQEVDELDFLHVLGLTPVGGGNLASGMGKKWRLWNPDDETPGWADEMLCSDLYLPETAANDPTLMEDQVHGLLDKPVEAPESEYFCEHCNRSLASEELYSRHLMSELHFKNSPIQESHLDERPKRVVKKPKFFDESREITTTSETFLLDPIDHGTKQDLIAPVTKESPKLMECSSCKAKVLHHQYGKHLVSHYHYHRSLGQPNNQEVILEHIGEIVRQSPFQCEPCSFYCNWHADFVSHIKVHDVKDQNGTFWCQVCMKIIHSNKLMVQHLKSYNHTELVSVINRSVPVIIKEITLIKCEECSKTFRFNLGLKKHMQVRHGQTNFELVDQPKYYCEYCEYFCYKSSSLKSHQFLVHPNAKLKYDCYVCKKQFTSKEIALAHRNSLSHKMNTSNKEDIIDSRKCNFCGIDFFDVDDLKEHLEICHVQELPQCHLCGGYFHFNQEIPGHLKMKCQPESKIVCTEGTYNCIHCPFFTCKESLLTLHDMYKHPPKENDISNCKKCPVCGEEVESKRLKIHLQTHNSNKNTCNICGKKFVAENSLREHMSLFHSNDSNDFHCLKCSYKTSKKILLNLHIKRQHSQHQTSEEICLECGVKFKLKTSLNNHMKTHRSTITYDFICKSRGCDFKCHFKSDLDRHSLKHLTGKDIKCEVYKCDFTCKRKNELVRHTKHVHESLPFIQCEHCEYKTKNKCHMNRHMKTHKLQEVAYYEVHLDENDFMVGKHEFANPPEFVTEQVIEN